jgi:hypothetical protein
MPSETYAQVVAVAKNVDGHRLLRVTEILAEVETSLRFSTSPRILFETAILKASMPQNDYDIEALISRVAELEKRLDNGEFTVKDGGRVETKEQFEEAKPVAKAVEKPVEVVKEAEEEVYDGYVPEEADVPPDDAFTGGYAYFDAVPVKKVEKKAVAPAPTPVAAVKTTKNAPIGDAKSTFGLFLRSMRKIARSGVLLTLCMDLDSTYEDDIFVLYTQSETIHRSLRKEEHFALIAQACAEIGLGDGFDVRLKGKKTDEFQKKVDEVKETFGGVKVDIK